MDNYHIALIGDLFEVVEDLPDGRHSTVGGFATMHDAEEWMDSFHLLIGLVSCMAGETLRS